jgi:glutamate--cysteine ligase
VESSPLTDDKLRIPFHPGGDVVERVGVEVECGVVRPGDGMAVPYDGADGVRQIMQDIAEGTGGTPVSADGNLHAVGYPDGTRLSLECGGAIEYSSRPLTAVGRLARETKDFLTRIARIAANRNAAILCDAYLPFNGVAGTPWIPGRRVSVMREWCQARGAAGRASLATSVLATSTQVTFDYRDGRDFTEKVRMQMAVLPVVAALTVNSPIAAGRPTGTASHRIELLVAEDPERFGLPPFTMKPDIAIDDFIDWAKTRPMMYRKVGGRYERAPETTFATAMRRGFPDGTYPTLADWSSQLCQLWPFIRARRTLEARLCDGPPFPHFGALAALWTGLTYHAPSRDAAWRLLRAGSAAEQMALIADVARRDLDARKGRVRVKDLAVEIVGLAEVGLRARIEAGDEDADAVELLAPLAEIARTGETFAAQKLRNWSTGTGDQAARYVATYRIPVG